MSKELNIIEAVNMPVGTEFEVFFKSGRKGTQKVIVSEELGSHKLIWEDGKDVKSYGCIINAKFIPVQKPVSFMEAIKARYEGKTIKVVLRNNERIYEDNSAGLKDQNGGYLTPLEILEGKWYIEEE